MSHRLTVGLILTLGAALTASAQINPGTGPAASLPQAQPRIPLPTPGATLTYPINISAPGSYVLTRNLRGVTGGAAITISASNVTLDLNGFLLEGAAGSTHAIALAATPADNLVIRNGQISGFVQGGINLNSARDVTIERILVDSCGGTGIDGGDMARVTACSVSGCAVNGISADEAALITDCDVRACGSIGIQVVTSGTVRDCLSIGNATGMQVSRALVQDCTSSCNTGAGIIALGDCTIERNHLYDNDADHSGSGAGVRLNGSGSVVRDNLMVTNARGVETTIVGVNNVIIRNVAHHNGTSAANNYGSVDTSDNQLGPIQDIEAATAAGTANVSTY